jgi:ribonuclease P protein component
MLNEKGNDKRLPKEEIIRGFESFASVLKNSTQFNSGHLKAFLNLERTGVTGVTTSPLVTKNVKVGFIIAGKKIKKAVKRNRIKRLLKEAYRLNKFNLHKPDSSARIIFSLNEQGYNSFSEKQELNLSEIENDMKTLLEKINKFLKRN